MVLDIYRVVLEMRSTRRSEEGSTSMIKIVRRPLGVVVGVTGVFMGLVILITGWIVRGYISVFGVLFLVALVKSFVHIRAGRVALHREWMIRAFAIGLAVVTQRLIFMPALLAVADPTGGSVTMLSAVSFMVAFVVHSSLAEIWIRLPRRSSTPGTSTKVLYKPAPDTG
jgi:uncharacterized membrane protein